MKSKILFFAISFTSLSAFSQISIWPKAGVNTSWTTYSVVNANVPYKNPSSFGFSGGFAVNFPVNDIFSIRPELTYNELNVSYTAEFAYYDGNSNLHQMSTSHNENRKYLSLPVAAVGHFKAGKGEFQISAGGYAALALNGSVSESSLQVTSFNGGGSTILPSTFSGPLIARKVPMSFPFTGYYNAVDFGVTAGLGYQLNKFLVTCQIIFGLSNTQPHYESETLESQRDQTVSNNQSVSLQLAYRVL